MKKLKIIKTVTDKITGKRFAPGTIIEREAKRGKDFVNAGVAEFVKPEPKKKPKKK